MQDILNDLVETFGFNEAKRLLIQTMAEVDYHCLGVTRSVVLRSPNGQESAIHWIKNDMPQINEQLELLKVKRRGGYKIIGERQTITFRGPDGSRPSVTWVNGFSGLSDDECMKLLGIQDD